MAKKIKAGKGTGVDVNMLISKWMSGERLDANERTIILDLIRANPGLVSTKASGIGGQSTGINTLPQMNANLGVSSSGYGKYGISPGGFKKSGLDADSMARMRGLVTDQRDGFNTADIKDDGTATFNGRKYSKSDVERIIRRGTTGATMSLADQSIYDRHMALRAKKRAEEIDAKARAESELAKNRVEAAEAQKRANRMRAIGLDPNEGILSEEELSHRETLNKERRAYLEKIGMREQEARIRENSREAKERELKNKLAKGGGYAYTRSQKERMNALEDELEKLWSDDSIGEEDRGKMEADIRAKIDRIRYSPRQQIQPEMTMEEDFKQGTYVDENGIRWTKDNNGKWSVAYDPKTAERDAKSAAAESKAEREREGARDKFINDTVNELLKERKEVRTSRTADPVKVPVWESYEDALDEAYRRAAIRFEGVNMKSEAERLGQEENAELHGNVGIIERKQAPAPQFPQKQQTWRELADGIAKSKGLVPAQDVNEGNQVQQPDTQPDVNQNEQAEQVQEEARKCAACGSAIGPDGKCTNQACVTNNNGNQ